MQFSDSHDDSFPGGPGGSPDPYRVPDPEIPPSGGEAPVPRRCFGRGRARPHRDESVPPRPESEGGEGRGPEPWLAQERGGWRDRYMYFTGVF